MLHTGTGGFVARFIDAPWIICAFAWFSMLTIAAKPTSMNTESLMHGSQNHTVVKTPVPIPAALHYAQASVMEFADQSSVLKEIMANVSVLIFGAAIAAASIGTPALAAHKSTPISAHQNGYVRRSSQGSGVYNINSPPSVYDPGARPYVYVPGMASGGQ